MWNSLMPCIMCRNCNSKLWISKDVTSKFNLQHSEPERMKHLLKSNAIFNCENNALFKFRNQIKSVHKNYWFIRMYCTSIFWINAQICEKCTETENIMQSGKLQDNYSTSNCLTNAFSSQHLRCYMQQKYIVFHSNFHFIRHLFAILLKKKHTKLSINHLISSKTLNPNTKTRNRNIPYYKLE